jgi:hypothetical protein
MKILLELRRGLSYLLQLLQNLNLSQQHYHFTLHKCVQLWNIRGSLYLEFEV